MYYICITNFIVMLNVRLDKETEKTLADYSDQNKLSKSSVVKEALAMYFTEKECNEMPFVLGEDLFGAASSGITNNSVSYKTKLKDKLASKHTH